MTRQRTRYRRPDDAADFTVGISGSTEPADAPPSGKTKLHMVIAFESREVHDMVARTGMADGAGESYDKLDELLASL